MSQSQGLLTYVSHLHDKAGGRPEIGVPLLRHAMQPIQCWREEKESKVLVSLLREACVLRFRGVPNPHHQVLLDERCS